MRYKLFACEILFREICCLAASSPHRIDLVFLPKGLHDIGRILMSDRLKEVLAGVDEDQYDAILFGYALCNGGTVGLESRKIPLVIPRAHDCITLFLGSRDRYRDYFFANSGTFFKTTGWIERGNNLVQGIPKEIVERLGLSATLEKMIEKYGEENGRYIWDQLTKMEFYSKMAFIETGLEPNDSFLRDTQKEAEKKGWVFEKLQGDLSLLERLLNGHWNEADFLIVPPGHRTEFSYDEDIMKIMPIDF